MSVVGNPSRILKAALIVAFVAGVTITVAAPASAGIANEMVYDTPQTDTLFEVPDGVCQVTVVANGASGGNGQGQSGGLGGTSTAVISVSVIDSLRINVGAQGSTGGSGSGGAGGSGGGGAGGDSSSQAGGGGGGASDVRLNGSALGNRVVVAGGGAGGAGGSTATVTGGAGGGQIGDDGTSTSTTGTGKGGTQSAGGAAGGGTASTAGSQGIGGAGASYGSSSGGAGGGGGGGYYGGGGGGLIVGRAGGGGGGGSGLTPDGNGMTNGAAAVGNGSVTLSWVVGGCDDPPPIPGSPLIFGDPGTYPFTVPTGVCSITVNASGASGGHGQTAGQQGGLGGTSSATFTVVPHETLQVNVGSEGHDATSIAGGGTSAVGGGGAGGASSHNDQHAGGGGGGSDVRQSGVVRTAAGGGGGGPGGSGTTVTGGAGGGATGAAGTTTGFAPLPTGGTNSAGGTGAAAATGAPGGTDGIMGTGGDGSSQSINGGGGGGGGGGYYGGGGGGAASGSAGSGGAGGSGWAPAGTTTPNAAARGDGMVSLTFTQDCPTAELTLTKECLGTMTGSPFAIEVRDSVNRLVADAPDELGCEESLSEPYPIFVNELYTVLETEVPAEADDVRYRGVCDGDGTLTVTDAGSSNTCVVTNVNQVDLVVTKRCDALFRLDGTFEISVYRESVDAGNLERTLTLECGEDNSADPLRIDDTVEYIVEETEPGHPIVVDYSQCGGDGVFTVAGADVRCTIENALPTHTLPRPPLTDPGAVTPGTPGGGTGEETVDRPPASARPATSQPKPSAGKTAFTG